MKSQLRIYNFNFTGIPYQVPVYTVYTIVYTGRFELERDEFGLFF